MKEIKDMNLGELAQAFQNAFPMGNQFYDRLRELHDLTRWTDSDVDAAYILGCINAHSIPLSGFETFPTLVATRKELERLKRIGFNTPSDAIRALRYPQRITPPEDKL
jgi:hypothetical protein